LSIVIPCPLGRRH